MKFEWEVIYCDSEIGISTCRAKVPGGWIVRTESWNENTGQSESSVFVNDINHVWEI